jgi:hypothetical protein
MTCLRRTTRSITIAGASTLACLLALCVPLRAGRAQEAPAPPPRLPAQITIAGNDYAFLQVPTTIAAGNTLFSFENRGRVRHELSVALLQPGVTLQQVMQAPPGQTSSRKFVESIVGILIARPGESSGGELFVDLKHGRRYIVVCTLKDTPDAQRHADLGMVTSFDVP